MSRICSCTRMLRLHPHRSPGLRRDSGRPRPPRPHSTMYTSHVCAPPPQHLHFTPTHARRHQYAMPSEVVPPAGTPTRWWLSRMAVLRATAGEAALRAGRWCGQNVASAIALEHWRGLAPTIEQSACNGIVLTDANTSPTHATICTPPCQLTPGLAQKLRNHSV